MNDIQNLVARLSPLPGTRGTLLTRRLAVALLGMSLGTLAMGCGPRNIRLDVPGTDPGQKYVCRSSPGEQADCQMEKVIDPALENTSGSKLRSLEGVIYVRLPKECRGRIHRVFINDVDASQPEVHVTCAPAEAPID